MLSFIKNLLPAGWLCLALLGSNLTTAYFVKRYYTQIKIQKIKCKNEKEKLQEKIDEKKEELKSCRDTVETLNDLYIEDTKITNKTQKRINRVKSYKSDYVDFSSLFD